MARALLLAICAGTLMATVLAAPAPSSIAAPGAEYFITVQKGQFMQGCVPFYPAGWNQWETMEAAAGYPYLTGASLPANTTGPEFIRDLLASGVSSGLNTLRAWAYSVDSAAAVQTTPGVYNEDALLGLDYLVDEARKKGVRLILAFTSNWTPVGGPQEYAGWANADPETGFFVNPSAKAMFKNYVKMIIQRVNKLNGRRYSEDPTIFAWNLINEPRCAKCPPGTIAAWVDEMAGFVKGLDANHLVTVGEDGFFGAGNFAKFNPGGAGNWAQLEGQDFLADHSSEHIDFATFHAWVDNWQVPTLEFQRAWISSHVAAAEALKKPVILEEFGKWFDDTQPDQSMKDRKVFMADAYRQVNEQLKSNGPLKGALFWQFYAEGQRAPFSEGGTRGLYGIYPSDDVFQDIAANAKAANALAEPQANCRPPAPAAVPTLSACPADAAGPGCKVHLNACMMGTLKCDPNAVCVTDAAGNSACQCLWGFQGTGRDCSPVKSQMDALAQGYWGEKEGSCCEPGEEVEWPTNGPGVVYNPFAPAEQVGSPTNVTLTQCEIACQMQPECESMAYNDVTLQCFLKRAQCPNDNSCFNHVETVCTSEAPRAGQTVTKTIPCGYWRTYYRLDMDVANACSNATSGSGRREVAAFFEDFQDSPAAAILAKGRGEDPSEAAARAASAGR